MKTTVNFKRILCPVAESHETDRGLHHAIALARSYDAKLFVLTCTNKSLGSTDKTDSAIRAGIERAIEDSFVMFQTTTAGLDRELIVVESNHTAESIQKEADFASVHMDRALDRGQPWDRIRTACCEPLHVPFSSPAH
jgi:nucleotide-binding universal stress UspA family protein